MKEGLIDAVIEQIAIDFTNEDMTALIELLSHVPDHYLQGYLSDINQGESK